MKTYVAEKESILKEADRIRALRLTSDGHPFDIHDHAAAIANAMLRTKFTAADIATIMLAMQIAQDCRNPKRHNRVGIVGAVWAFDRCREQQDHDYAQVMIQAEAAGVPVGTSREMLDIPEFLRMDPGIVRAAEALVEARIKEHGFPLIDDDEGIMGLVDACAERRVAEPASCPAPPGCTCGACITARLKEENAGAERRPPRHTDAHKTNAPWEGCICDACDGARMSLRVQEENAG